MASEFINRINGSFKSSTGVTPEWKAFFTSTKRHLKKILSEFCENIDIHRGHFYFSGFLTRKSDGQIFYISCHDVRSARGGNMLIRTADSYWDFTGGPNDYISLNANFETILCNYIKKFPDRRSNAKKFIDEIATTIN